MSSGPPTAKVEKVRGMNASLTTETGTGNPLSERDPGRLHITRRQVVFALGLAILVVVATIYTISSVSAGDQSFPAVVTTSKVFNLNFATTAKVTAVTVKVGQHVKPGQVLATQDSAALKTQEAADAQTVTADTEVLSQANSPQLTAAQREQDSLEVEQGQVAVDNAEAALQSEIATGKANVASAGVTVTNAESLETSDDAQYTQACPKGPVAPASNLAGAPLAAAQASYARCQTLQTDVTQDEIAVNQAQAELGVVKAQAQQAVNSAQSTVDSSQIALNVSEGQVSLATSPSPPSAIAQAQSNLNQAQAQLAEIQQELKDAMLVAPDGGVIAEIYGVAGEYLGPDGVHIYPNAPALPENQSSGFTLFPAQPSAQGSSSSSSGDEPLIELVGGAQQVLAQVPQSNVSSLQVGHSVSVYFSALNITETGVVTGVGLSPTRDSNAVTYDVTITLKRTVSGLLPGMSASVQQ